jgi:hypothetical protein
VKYAAIADWATDKQFTVTFMCAQLGVVRQGYYRWLADGSCERERTDAELTEQIREIHAQLHGHPGVRRVWAELVVRGLQVARKPHGRRPPPLVLGHPTAGPVGPASRNRIPTALDELLVCAHLMLDDGRDRLRCASVIAAGLVERVGRRRPLPCAQPSGAARGIPSIWARPTAASRVQPSTSLPAELAQLCARGAAR